MSPARARDQTDPMSSGKLAMWSFLVSEAMFIAGPVVAYVAIRTSDPVRFDPTFLARTFGSTLDVPLATVETLVLILASWTMAHGVDAVSRRNNLALRRCLLLTAALGLSFCGFRWIEYGVLRDRWIFPGTSIFHSFYFALTGVHLVHVIGGVVFLLGFFVAARDGRHVKPGNSSVECLGLYWHFATLAWFFLFPLFYLIR